MLACPQSSSLHLTFNLIDREEDELTAQDKYQQFKAQSYQEFSTAGRKLILELSTAVKFSVIFTHRTTWNF